MDRMSVKTSHLDQLADYTRALYRAPELRKLFFELTLRCNERCFHCGSSCAPDLDCAGELSREDWFAIIDQVKADFDISRMQLCITGGEPLLHRDFFDIMGYAHERGFRWGMTSNATLITPEVAARLAEVGMGTISVSIDGLRETHDALRGLAGGYDRAMAGIQNLIDVGTFHAIQVTTVVNHSTIDQLDDLFAIMDDIDIDSWRVINLEPIGRALSYPDLMLTRGDYVRLFEFIREKRRAGFPVEYGCNHYLGLDYEAEVREWYWLCNAGVYTASIMANGDIGACLDIERRPETIQGNIRTDRLRDVWENRFELFRRDLAELNAECRACEHARHCRGDAHHSWDYDTARPLVCLKGTLF